MEKITNIQLPELGEVAELIRTTREERAWLKKLFRLLQEARRLGIQTSPAGEAAKHTPKSDPKP